MRRSVTATVIIPVLGLALLGAPCSTTGPGARHFDTGALVIPMDNCYQKRDASGAPGGQATACNVTADDGVLRAYGLVYQLLRHGITVYWTIDGATPKTSLTGPDVTIQAPSGSLPVVKKLDWASGAIIDYAIPGCSSNCGFPNGTQIQYIGGPFLVDVAQKQTALDLLHNHADFASYRSEHNVDIHEVENAFDAPQVRPISGPPPKIAILNIAGPKTAANVMIGYARAAGFDWTCSTASGNCAGGVSGKDASCTAATILSTYGITVNNGPGLVYDLLCDKDFLPDYNASPPDFTKSTLLGKDSNGAYVYKLLWAPHWETKRPTNRVNCPSGTPSSTYCGTVPDPSAAVGSDSRNLADYLTCISTFVSAGNNLFAECHAIVTLEGGYGQMNQTNPIREVGLAATRFQTTNTMNRSVNSTIAAGSLTEFRPAEPNMQIADFVFSVGVGNVSAFLADPNGNTSFTPNLAPSSYNSPWVKHFVTQSSGSPPLDVFTTFKNEQEGATGGTVVYLGGHNYSPDTSDYGTNNTAGTRMVLNTLFNLGFACQDPNTDCNTGQLGVCAKGKLQCNGSGGLTCVRQTAPSAEVCGDGLDNDCNGYVDDGCYSTPACHDGDPDRACYTGATGCTGNVGGPYTCTGACKAGTQTCSGGAWGACRNQVVPGPEVCNGKDDNCDGQVDEGTLCPQGYTCTNGACLPPNCGLEGNNCPLGFTCTSGSCVQVSGCSQTCAAGTVCNGSSCVDPCASITCGQGSTCSGGLCVGGGCSLAGCSTGQICSQGQCVTDPCATAGCPTGTFCRIAWVGQTVTGDCVRSCSYVQCPQGQSCTIDGFCETPVTCSPACGTGQVCVNGACQADPCTGLTCASGQTCQNGVCLDDPCRLIQCPQGSSCSSGQCQGTPPGGWGALTPPTSSGGGGGGCGYGSSGGGSFLGLALVSLFLARRRFYPRLLRELVPCGLAAILVLSGCGGGKSNPTCQSGQTLCGDACADLSSDMNNCGVCGQACPTGTGFTCTGYCTFATGNPYVSSISPSVASPGRGGLTVTFTGRGFLAGAKARFVGGGLDGEKDLKDITDTSAQLQQALDLSVAYAGTVQVRVVNPGHLISNAATLTLTVGPHIYTLTPAGARQDQLATTSVALTGDAFASGMTATLTPAAGGTAQSLTVAVQSATQATVTGLDASLPLGLYDLAVQIPGGGSAAPQKFTVVEGAPILSSVTPTCGVLGTFLAGTASGQYLYPSSVAHVTGPGLPESVIDSQCTAGASGRCTGDALAISTDLTNTNLQAGTYYITIWNPGPLVSGTPQPLKSASPGQAVTIKSTCP